MQCINKLYLFVSENKAMYTTARRPPACSELANRSPPPQVSYGDEGSKKRQPGTFLETRLRRLKNGSVHGNNYYHRNAKLNRMI